VVYRHPVATRNDQPADGDAIPVDVAARLHAAAAAPGTAAVLSVHRVRKAYEQVADQLRELIVTGYLTAGERLPNEATLAKQFGVSRATVREALRILAAQRLILTAKGVGGGTYVSQPGFDVISDFLQANIDLLTEMRHITLDELLEAREHLEVHAARLAAERRNHDDLERLHASVPGAEAELGVDERFGLNINFHSVLMEMSGNGLFYIAALPVFSVLQTRLARSQLGDVWHREVSAQHADIAAAVEAGDGGAAATLMRDHLAFIRPSYEAVWRHAAESRPRH
jgi:DNA-binding FadR family transcriptional regulator